MSSDTYYLAFPNEPLQRKLLVYAVYLAETAQAIILARMAYVQFADGYGNFDALNAIPVILWFGVPILSSIGMYHPSFLATCRSLAYKYISDGCGPNFLCLQNQIISRILCHPECGCFGEFRFQSRMAFSHLRSWHYSS
jgi:hypothetical protein